MAPNEVDAVTPTGRPSAEPTPVQPSRAASTRGLSRRWWAWPLLIYTVTRIVNAVMIVVASRSAITMEEFVRIGGNHYGTSADDAPLGYLTAVTRWDGQWYWEIAAHGYPAHLPVDAAGAVQENPWAFFPLYPYIVRAVMFVSRQDFPIAASIVSLTFGALAMMVLYRLVARRHGHLGGVLAVLGLSTFVCAPVFQIAYTESLALFLVLLTISLVIDRRHGWALLTLALLGLTRGVAVAFAPALALYVVMLWRRGELSRPRLLRLGGLAAAAAATGVAWPVIAGVVTGQPRAYFLTQQAWNPELSSIPILRFVERNSDVPGGTAGAFVFAILWAAVLLWFLGLGQREPLMRAWVYAYVLYVLAVVDWNWSAVRYYLLALPVFWPLVAAAPERDNPRQRVVVAIVFALVGLALQWWWIRYCVIISPQLVQVP